MTDTAWPGPAELLEHHERMLEALRVLARQFAAVTADPRSKFFGKLHDEFDELLLQMREELDEQTVMMMVASCEATLRIDFDGRLRDKTKDRVRRRFKELRSQYEERVQLDQILDAWREETGEVERIGRLRQLVKRRHWLAHGRYWRDKSGVSPDPRLAGLVIDDLLQALQRCLPDFPRT